MTNTPVERMKAILLDAYRHPDRGGVFYSANSAPTGSDRLNRMPFWDWTPEPTRFVDKSSTVIFPLALGCKRVEIEEGKEWFEPMITDPAHVSALKLPDVHAGRTGEILRAVEAMVRDESEWYRIRSVDIQSPLGVAELIWDKSFYVALIETPEAVHELLDKITTFIIAFVKALRRIGGTRMNGCGFPGIWSDHEGVMVSDDTMSLVSPAMHREFSLAYLQRLADACGPLYYHSCTWRQPYFDNIRRLHPVRTLNWNPGNSDDPALLFKAFAGAAVLTPHLVLDMHRDNDVLKLGRNFADEYEFFKYMLDSIPSEACVYFWFSNVVGNGPVIEKIYNLLDERGLTPRARGLI